MSEKGPNEAKSMDEILRLRSQQMGSLVASGSIESALRARIAAIDEAVGGNVIDIDGEGLMADFDEPPDVRPARMKAAMKYHAKERQAWQ